MDLQHVNVKIYVDGDLGVEPERFIGIFQRWIKEELLDELLIDVADYRHVPAGPGVMLIAHEADYSMDNAGKRWGLRYNRKAAVEGTNVDRFRQAFASALTACRMLEAEFADGDALRFSRDAFELFINDRACAPNTPETFASAKPEIEAFLQGLLGHSECTLAQFDDPRSRFGVAVKCGKPFDLAELLQAARLGDG